MKKNNSIRLRFKNLLFISTFIFFLFQANFSFAELKYLEGWPKTIPGNYFSSPLICDIDPDGTNELIVASLDNKLFVYNATGVMRWYVNLPDCAWGETSTPAVGDVDGDGDLEIVIASCSGRIVIISNLGKIERDIFLGDFVVRNSVVLFELPRTNEDENVACEMGILVGTGSDGVNGVYALHAFRYYGVELTGWPKVVKYRIHSTPAVGDIDNDGSLEIVVGCDGQTTNTGYVYAWKLNGTKIWEKTVGGHVDSSPALADIDDDGDLEIFVGCLDQNLYAWHHDGSVVNGWPVKVGTGIWQYGMVSSPAIGDVDSDGQYEIFIGTGIIQSMVGGYLFAFKEDGTKFFQEIQFPNGPVTASPILANVKGDSKEEIVVGGQDGYLYAYDSSGYVTEDFPVNLGYEITATAAFGNLSKDFTQELAVITKDGKIHVWALETSSFIIPSWPTFHHDRHHHGNFDYVPEDPRAVNIQSSALIKITVVLLLILTINFFLKRIMKQN